MTIQEAIKTGKKFKRKHKEWWLYPLIPYNGEKVGVTDYSMIIYISDILAEDWEIKK